MRAPTSTVGNAAAAIAVLAAGTAVGATVGFRISPMPAMNKTVGALEGAGLGVLVTSLAGLLAGYWYPGWKRVGETTALLGLGGITLLAVSCAASAASAAKAARLAPPPSSTSLPGVTTPVTTLLTVVPGAMGAVVPVGAGVSLQLPQGAQWSSGGANPVSGNAPLTWVYQGAGDVLLTWTDASGASESTTVVFTNAA